MSFVFDVGDDTVWSPSLRIGHVFAGYVRVLEGVVGVTAGLFFISSDYIEIDPLALTQFRQALMPLVNSTNPLLHEQVKVVFAIVEVLLQRANGSWAASTSLDENMAAYILGVNDAIGKEAN